MGDLYALVELAITMLASSFWTFILYNFRPQWVSQNARNRLIVSIIEGVICTVIWLLLLVITATPITLESVEIAVLCGLIWAALTIYMRGRYKAVLTESTTY